MSQSRYITLRNRIASHVKPRGALSVSGLARRADVSRANLSKYVRGLSDLNGETIDKILRAID